MENQIIDSFSQFLQLQQLLQNHQEENLVGSQMFYDYITNQINNISANGQDCNNSIRQKNSNQVTLNITKDQIQQNGIKKSQYIEIKDILEIYLKKNLIYYEKWKKFQMILQEKLNNIQQLIVMQRSQVIEIDLESQETRIILRGSNQLNEKKELNEEDFEQDQLQIQLNSNIIIFDSLNNSNQSIQEIGEFFLQTDLNDSNRRIDLQRSKKEKENNIQRSNDDGESFQKSFQSMLNVLNNENQDFKDNDNQKIEIEQEFLNIEQNVKPDILPQNQNNKLRISQPIRKQNHKKMFDHNSSPKNKNNQYVIEIESENENSQDNLMKIEQKVDIIMNDNEQQQILNTSQKQQSIDKDLSNIIELKGPLTRSASKKLEKCKTQSDNQKENPKQDEQEELFHMILNKSVNNAICISNSFDKKQLQISIESFTQGSDDKKSESNLVSQRQTNQNKQQQQQQQNDQQPTNQQTINHINSLTTKIPDQSTKLINIQQQKTPLNQSSKIILNKISIENVKKQMANAVNQEQTTAINQPPMSIINQQLMSVVDQVKIPQLDQIPVKLTNQPQKNIINKQIITLNKQQIPHVNQSQQQQQPKELVNNFSTNIINQQDKFIKREFQQPIIAENIINEIKINPNQDLQINQNNKENINDQNKNGLNIQYNQQEIKKKDIIVITPKDSRIQSQISPNSSCFIVQEKKLGKKIVKQDKKSPQQIINKDQKQLDQNQDPQIKHQSTQGKLKKKIIIKN